MEDKKSTVTYPVSTRYREQWGDWEAIREITQNALDSGAMVNFDFDLRRKTLTIRDYGSGFELHHLLIGETEKDGETSIGKFGEGLKFALLVLVRQGRKVEIRSNNLKIKAKLVYMFDRQTLAVDWEKGSTAFSGTEVVIRGIPRSYRERFLSLNHSDNMHNKVLKDRPGQLFVKGIYVKDINAVAGYNLCIERENPLSGDVDSWEVQYSVSCLIEATVDSTYISMLLQALKNEPDAPKTEFVCGSYQDWHSMHTELWESEAAQIFGPKVCLSTDPELFHDMQRDGYSVLITRAHFPKGFMKTDLQVVRARGDAEWIPTQLSDLPPESLKNLAEATYLVNHITEFPLEVMSVGSFPNDPHVGAMARQSQYIRISVKALDKFSGLVLILIEELIHYLAGTGDLTPRHEAFYNQSLERLIEHFIKDVPSNCPPEWMQKLISQDKENKAINDQ